MYHIRKSAFLAIIISAILFTSCSEPDDVVSAMLFEAKPRVIENVNFNLNLVNGWFYDGAYLYGLDMFAFNRNESTVERITLQIKNISPSTHLAGYSEDPIEIIQILPMTSRNSTAYFAVDQTYIGNFYVFLSTAVGSNVTVTVTFDVSLQYGGRTYNFDIDRTFRTISSHIPLSRTESVPMIPIN